MQQINKTDFGTYNFVKKPLEIHLKKVGNNDNTISFSSDAEENNQDDNDINAIAHKGYSSIAPENTIPAIIAAAENGYKTVECDIEWTKDSVPVLLHDSTINRTARKSNGKKLFFPRKCSNMNYKELLKYDFGSWKGEKYKGTKIPTYNELLDCCKDNGLNVYVELKKSSKFDAQKAKILVDAVKEAGLEDKITWISFEDDYLKEIKKLMPEARLGYLSKNTPNKNTIDILESLQTDKNEIFLDVKASKMTEEASNLLEKSGYDFEAWIVNDCKQLDNLFSYDCKAITTDTITEEHLDKYYDETFN